MSSDSKKTKKIALALSGGGSRALAFHLGTLRSLEKNGLLKDVELISSVSGGSVLAALYCTHEGDFESFEKLVRSLLIKGLLKPSILKIFSSLLGVKALVNWILVAIDRILSIIVCKFFGILIPGFRSLEWAKEPYIRRVYTRSIMLRDTLDDVFHSANLTDLRADKPKLVMVACDLRNQSAFYFTKEQIGSWRLGKARSKFVSIATAVVSSAAYPLFLPPVDLVCDFEKNKQICRKNVWLTDGGIYDNLGLSPLWPDRSPHLSLDFGVYQNIIVSRAGYGVEKSNISGFLPSRLKASFFVALNRSENSSVNRIFEHQKYGRFGSVLLSYLGQNDINLKFKPENFVAREIVADYPTNFNAMPKEWIDVLSKRGEQVTDALIHEHWS